MRLGAHAWAEIDRVDSEHRQAGDVGPCLFGEHLHGHHRLPVSQNGIAQWHGPRRSDVDKFYLSALGHGDDFLAELGRCLNLQKRYAEAEQILDRGLVRYPGNVDLMAQRGSVLLSQKKFVDASAQFEQALAVDKDIVTALLGSVVVCRAQNGHAAAIAAYNAVIARVPFLRENC